MSNSPSNRPNKRSKVTSSPPPTPKWLQSPTPSTPSYVSRSPSRQSSLTSSRQSSLTSVNTPRTPSPYNGVLGTPVSEISYQTASTRYRTPETPLSDFQYYNYGSPSPSRSPSSPLRTPRTPGRSRTPPSYRGTLSPSRSPSSPLRTPRTPGRSRTQSPSVGGGSSYLSKKPLKKVPKKPLKKTK